jgi:hypothetical protein
VQPFARFRRSFAWSSGDAGVDQIEVGGRHPFASPGQKARPQACPPETTIFQPLASMYSIAARMCLLGCLGMYQ